MSTRTSDVYDVNHWSYSCQGNVSLLLYYVAQGEEKKKKLQLAFNIFLTQIETKWDGFYLNVYFGLSSKKCRENEMGIYVESLFYAVSIKIVYIR